MVDVARLAGVSLKTVSRVVNGEAGVRPATKARVEEAIGHLGFRRNDSASDLRRGRTESVGLIVEDVADPFYSVLTLAVERAARKQRHLLLTGSAEGSAERERSLAGAFLSRRVAGLIVVPAVEDHRWLAAELAAGTPVVFVDRPATGLSADTVVTDNEAGVRSAVEHLAARGHRGIGFIGDDAHFWTAGQRLAAFGSATSALGLRPDLTAMGPHQVERIAELLVGWIDNEGVTGIVTGNNRVSLATLRALRRIDRQVAMVGFDDFELADLLDPAVTVVAQDPAAMGERAAHLLFRRLSGQGGAPRTEILPNRLVVRDSSRLR
jgi:LacI family transcriptional regulator, galactose operon repressor